MIHDLYCGDCLEILKRIGEPVDCIFADPPDNIGLRYASDSDKRPDADYVAWLAECVAAFAYAAPTVWLSFNAKWTFQVGELFAEFLRLNPEWEGKPCVQVFTFGQHRQTDLGNNHRPLWRLKRKDAPAFPDQIRVPSWRQLHGDKRADPRGRVPGDVFAERGEAGIHPGDVFDFPRVTGNSKQRCNWHPTQLHEELVECCLALSTVEGGRVLDPFAGTGTTLRVCRRIGRECVLIESDPTYCEKIRTCSDSFRQEYCIFRGEAPHWSLNDARID